MSVDENDVHLPFSLDEASNNSTDYKSNLVKVLRNVILDSRERERRLFVKEC